MHKGDCPKRAQQCMQAIVKVTFIAFPIHISTVVAFFPLFPKVITPRKTVGRITRTRIISHAHSSNWGQGAEGECVGHDWLEMMTGDEII